MVESWCFLSFLQDERREEKKKRRWKKENVKKTHKKKGIVTLFLYTRKAQNRRRIHRVVAVYPATNGTEFRCKFSFYLRCWKIFGKILAISVERHENAFERYLLFAQFFSAVHKCFPNVNSQRYVFCRGNDVPLNAAVPRERERQRPRFKRGYPTRSSQPGERKIIAG